LTEVNLFHKKLQLHQLSNRTRREVSPQATIRHLQYNSPMNIYSIESAAEQYLRQTGGLFGTETEYAVHPIKRNAVLIMKPELQLKAQVLNVFRPLVVHQLTNNIHSENINEINMN
uniref:Zasp-like motif domain-containing protein n=1 Tax=Parascaris equorum TaxID=6256 RepID=A0A914R679_PAREQ